MTGHGLEGSRGLRSPSHRRLPSPSSDRSCTYASLHFFNNYTPSSTSACLSLCRAETHRTGSHVKLRHRERRGREKEGGRRSLQGEGASGVAVLTSRLPSPPAHVVGDGGSG